MEPLDFLQLIAGLLTVVLIILGVRRFGADLSSLLAQLHQELRRFPVYSAETTRNREAEFIRDRPPSKLPRVIALAILIAVGAVVWWLSR